MQRACDDHEWDVGMRPWLVLMGFDSQTADDQLAAVVEVPDHRQYVQARAFSTNVDDIHRTLRTSSMLIMPSLSEGFGLTGYEAIAAGIPVLISNESGLAIYLDRAAKGGKISQDIVDRVIVRVVGEPQRVAEIWSRRIIDQLSNPERAFDEAGTLREGLRPMLTWVDAARQLTTALTGIIR